MSKALFENLGDLTAQERQDLIDMSFRRPLPAPAKRSQYVRDSIGQAAEIVRTRYGEGREKRPGFAAVVAPMVVFQRALTERIINVRLPADIAMYRQVLSDQQSVVERVEVDTWSQEPGDDKYAKAAVVKGVIAAMTGAPSGSISTMMLATMDRLPLNQEELALNIPGAVLIGHDVVTVSGLYPPNDQEIAEIIGMGSLMLAHGEL